MYQFYAMAWLGFLVFFLLDLASRKSSAKDLLLSDVVKQYRNTDGLYLIIGFILINVVLIGITNGEQSVIEKFINMDLPKLGLFVSFLIGVSAQFFVSVFRKIKFPLSFKTTNKQIDQE